MSEATVKRWADAGTLKCFRTPGGHRKFRMSDVADFLRSHNYEAAGPVDAIGGGESVPSMSSASDRPDAAHDPLVEVDPEAAVRFRNLALSSDVDGLVSLVAQQRLRGQSLAGIFDGMVYAALADIGDRWARGVLTVSQEHMAAGAVIESLARTKPLVERPAQNRGRLVIACPGEEQHDIAARMVSLLAFAAGYSPMLIGARAPARDVALLVTAERPRIVVLSASASHDQGELKHELATVSEASRAVGSRLLVGGGGFERLESPPEGAELMRSMNDLAARIARD